MYSRDWSSNVCSSDLETLLSLSQTSRSLRRFFWRYLWQRIEVREGMKIWDKDEPFYSEKSRTHTGHLSQSRYTPGHKGYATELVRQLEIVTVRNPQLAQYVKSVLSELLVLSTCSLANSYLDIYVGKHSFESVLAELERCLSLFSNLHTVQVDISAGSSRGRNFDEIFEETFKKYSYPQIRNVFVMYFTLPFIASCPQARRVGFPRYSIHNPCLQTILSKCPHLEVLECSGEVFCSLNACRCAFLYLFLSLKS